MAHPRIALVHDWLTGMRGGEKCLEPLCRLWPDARLYTLLHFPGRVSPAIEHLQPRTSALQRLPRVDRYYRYLLPVMPAAANWRLDDCDVVLSLSHCVAKSAAPPPGVPHLCYCFTPMRYAWHLRDSYFAAKGFGRLRRWAADLVLARLRTWDRVSSNRVTQFIAISRTVQQRIRECYGRDSTVVPPPVDTEFYTPADGARGDYYLCVSALAPYKRIDLAIHACNRRRTQLVVIGAGEEQRRLRDIAGPTIRFLGWQSDEMLRRHYRQCRALLFPGEEDFGIVPLEAMACGAPVIAFGRGGATETVAGCGYLFAEQSADSLLEAMAECERSRGAFDAASARRRAEQFAVARYVAAMQSLVVEACQKTRPAADAAGRSGCL